MTQSNLSEGVLMFRHPILKGKGGRGGKVIRKGIGKLPSDEQRRIKADLDRLLQLRPTRLKDAPPGICQEAFGFYFELMVRHWLRKFRKYSGSANAESAASTSATSRIKELKAQVRELAEAKQRISQLESQMNTLIGALGEAQGNSAKKS